MKQVMLDELVADIYGIVTDRRRLAILANLLQDEFESHSSAVVIAEPDRYFLLQSNVSPDSAEAYNHNLWHHDVWMREFLVRTSETVLSGHQMCAYSDIAADYRHHVLEAADTFDGMSTRVVDTPDLTASISLYRSKSQGVFQTCDFEKMLYLAPHLKRAFSLQQVFGDMKRQRNMLEQAIDHIPGAAFIVDPTLRIVAMNDSADQLLVEKCGVGSRHGRLMIHNKTASDALQHSLSMTIMNGIPAIFVMTAPDRAASAVVRVTRLDSDLSDDVRTLAGGARQKHLAIITFNFPQTLPAGATSLLTAAFALTHREAEAAVLIAEGAAPHDAAERMGVKISTFRSFLKSALAKLDVSRQSEMAVKIHSLFARH